MNNLIVVYDKEIEDKGRDSYIKAIKKTDSWCDYC